MEAIFKLIAYGIIGYFKNSWNRFDFFVVLCSIIDIAMVIVLKNVTSSILRVGP